MSDSDIKAETMQIVSTVIPTDRYVDIDLILHKLRGTKMEGCTTMSLVSVLDELVRRDVIEFGVDARVVNKKVIFFRRKG